MAYVLTVGAHLLYLGTFVALGVEATRSGFQ
jgi:hypothetical protein